MGAGITPVHSVTSLICRAALMYRLWLEGKKAWWGHRFHVRGWGWRSSRLFVQNSPMKSAAKVKGRR